MTTYTGKCNCGQTEWEVTLQDDQAKHILCHCQTCKTLSGGAFTLNQIVPKSSLKFTKGGDDLKVYSYKGDTGNEVKCYYCPNCTTHPYHHQTAMGPDTIVLRTGLLNKGKDMEPAVEIYGKDRLFWQKEVAKTFEVTPPKE